MPRSLNLLFSEVGELPNTGMRKSIGLYVSQFVSMYLYLCKSYHMHVLFTELLYDSKCSLAMESTQSSACFLENTFQVPRQISRLVTTVSMCIDRLIWYIYLYLKYTKISTLVYENRLLTCSKEVKNIKVTLMYKHSTPITYCNCGVYANKYAMSIISALVSTNVPRVYN